MCNAEIIRTAQALNNVTEECHTYAKWKSMGYQVRRGEHALFKATIWKYAKKKDENGDEEARMFMKSASFFGRAQVERITW